MGKAILSGLAVLIAGGMLWGQQYLITSVAGGGLLPSGVSAIGVAVMYPEAVAADGRGNVYFGATVGITAGVVFRVDSAGAITHVAGNGKPGHSGDGGDATAATLNTPNGLALDAAGNLYIADSGNFVVRKVSTEGIITTVAGSGTPGYSGDGGPATSARLWGPWGLALDREGNLYIADAYGYVVRKVSSDGIIRTVAGNGIWGYSGDGSAATTARLAYPRGLAVDGAGNLYIADYGNSAVREVTADGIIHTVAGNGMAGYAGDGGPATGASLSLPSGVAVTGAGNLYISDSDSAVVRKVDASGVISTVAGNGTAGYSGDGGPALAAMFNQPDGLAVDPAGNIFIADTENNRVRKVAGGTVITIAGNGSIGPGDGGPGTNALLNEPVSVVPTAAGDLYIGDYGDAAVRRLSAAGVMSTVAGNGRGCCAYGGADGALATSVAISASGLAVDGTGNLYMADVEYRVVRKLTPDGIVRTVAGNGDVGYSGDGGPASAASLDGPQGLALDREGNLYIADTWNNVVRKVTTDGVIHTVAGNGAYGYSGDGGPATGAQLYLPYGVAVDAQGDIYIADSHNSAVREVTPDGIIHTVAGTGSVGYSGDGGPAKAALLNLPEGLALDAAGNLYIADTYNSAVREVTTDGIIHTVAGDGTQGFSGDGGPATAARLNWPQGLAVDSAGNVFVADTYNNVIRMLLPEGSRALLGVAVSHAGTVAQGQTGLTYSVLVSNAAGAGPTGSATTVTENLPPGLTLVSIGGTGWGCSGASCTRSDTLGAGASYPPITVTVDVAADAPPQLNNQVTVGFGGAVTATASDTTTILVVPEAPGLTSPANRSTGVVGTPTLVWSAANGATSYDVYFGTSPAPPLVANTTSLSYAPSALDLGTTYYWQIVTRTAAETAASAVWSFTTTATVPTGLRFVPVIPCRLADTREASIIAGGTSRAFAVPKLGCGVPDTAPAYSLNVTAVPTGPLGFLTIWPTGQARPNVSTLNSWEGVVVANAAIVPAGNDGAVSVYVSDDSHLILDINGYFDTSTGPTSYAFYPAAPCRVVDTRSPTAQFGGPSMDSTEPRDFPIPLSTCSIPATARSYSLNVTVVPSGYLGFLTTWPTGQPQPNVSTLNSWTGKVVANAALVPGGTNESVSVYVSNPTDVIMDINGYFAQPGSAGALSFYPVTPCRVTDTRFGGPPFGGPEMGAQETRSYPIPTSGCNVPSTAQAYSLNVSVVPDGYLGYLTTWPAGATRPFASMLNSWDGSVVANAAIVPAGANGAVDIFVTNPTQVIIDINGYFAQ